MTVYLAYVNDRSLPDLFPLLCKLYKLLPEDGQHIDQNVKLVTVYK